MVLNHFLSLPMVDNPFGLSVAPLPSSINCAKELASGFAPAKFEFVPAPAAPPPRPYNCPANRSSAILSSKNVCRILKKVFEVNKASLPA